LTTPPGMTNHHGHPLNYPFLLTKASRTHLLAANTNKVVQLYDIQQNKLIDIEQRHTATITDIFCDLNAPNVFLTSSEDGTV
jgi:WD40 repeat protein